jgi:hypothetical protein
MIGYIVDHRLLGCMIDDIQDVDNGDNELDFGDSRHDNGDSRLDNRDSRLEFGDSGNDLSRSHHTRVFPITNGRLGL